jgi:hypothetical protein
MTQQLPTITPITRIDKEEGPPIWYWKEADVGIYGPRLAATLPKKTPGALTMWLEEYEFRRNKRYFCAYFKTFTDAGLMMEEARELMKVYEIPDLYIRLTPVERDFVSSWNDMRKYYMRVNTRTPPRTDETGSITYHLNLLQELTRPGRERVFYGEDSEVPQVMAAVRELFGEATDTDFPAVASVVYGAAACYHHETIEEVKKKKPYEFLGPDDPYLNWDPFGKDDKVMNYDPFRNM